MIASAFLAFFLVLTGLFALALQRFYSSVPAKELKRLAARGDHLAAALFRPVAYGETMRLLLWLVFSLSISGGFLVLIFNTATWAAFISIVLVMAAVVWLQSVRLTVHSAKIAVIIAPGLHKILTYAHGPLRFITRSINHYRQHVPHSGLYEKEDIVALLRQQREQPDNRMSPAELELLERAASFDDKMAADIVLPWSQVKLVKTDDHLGPILLGELHSSGQTSFLVYEDTPTNIVGTLFLRDAIHAKEGGLVSSIMQRHVCFVHEDFSLRQVLEAFTRTGQFMVVVVNKFEEATGVITLQHLLSQLVGDIERDDLAYEDRAAVAAFVPQLQPAEEPIADEIPEEPSTEETEVVK